ncbi:MAG TPA: glycosyltransferase, partial [Erythrobacter sp.]|nr:glycosyltransferase [Erythrobacter sp.]
GAVDDLSPWYAGAALVIAPILSGSGMKTKVAEALMHGKRVAGTSEAFVGYGAEVLAANHLCDDSAGIAAAIAAMVAQRPPAFDLALRALYERHHSRAAFGQGLRAVLADQLALTSR